MKLPFAPRFAAACAAIVALSAALAGCQADDGEMKNQTSGSAGLPTTKPATAQMQPRMQAILDAWAEVGLKPPTQLSVQQAKQLPGPADAVQAFIKQEGRDVAEPQLASMDERTIPGPAGEIPVRVFTPEGEGPFPVIVYFHGGGWVIFGVDDYAPQMQALAEKVGAVVVGVSYRQAPQHKFPAAPEDAYAATQYIIDNAAQFKGDPDRVAVAGESAGGNLATVVCLMARDRGGDMPVHQLLVYPVTNYWFNTQSYIENADAKPLNKPLMEWFWNYYLPDPSAGDNIYASPLKADNLSALPPATVITAQIDPLRSEGQDYAMKLRQDGVDVAYRNYDGVTHEFFGMAPVLEDARNAQQFAADRLSVAFEK